MSNPGTATPGRLDEFVEAGPVEVFEGQLSRLFPRSGELIRYDSESSDMSGVRSIRPTGVPRPTRMDGSVYE